MIESDIECNQYLVGGDDLNQRFVEHGFTDVRVIEKVVDIGNWRQPQGYIHTDIETDLRRSTACKRSRGGYVCIQRINH